jgi:DNA-binding transcriptional MerR regulator
MAESHLIDIGDVVKHTGFAASALRYYERLGLITSAGRHGQRRLYDPQIIDRLATIAAATQAGFRLDELAKLLDGGGDQDEQLRDSLRAKADELDVSIARLTAARDRLRHAADCPATPIWNCPDFLRDIEQHLPAQRRASG